MFIDERAKKFADSLKALGGVMQFIVFHLEQYQEVNQDTHKLALNKLFEEVAVSMQQHQQEVMKRYPHYKKTDFLQLSYDLSKVRADRLSTEQIQDLTSYKDWKQGKAALFYAFSQPPYSMKLTEAEAIQKFKLWLPLIGLIPKDSIEVLDWVGDPDINPGQSTWSNYFDEGKEWWGIHCYTIYNPKLNTISAVMASATD